MQAARLLVVQESLAQTFALFGFSVFRQRIDKSRRKAITAPTQALDGVSQFKAISTLRWQREQCYLSPFFELRTKGMWILGIILGAMAPSIKYWI